MGSAAAMAVAREAIGEGVVVTGDRNISIGREIIEYFHLPPTSPDVNLISGEQAFERIGAAFRLNLKQLEENMEQARSESSQFFKLTLVFSALGFIVVLAGILLLLMSQVTGAVVTSVSSVIPEVTAILFFTKDKELRKMIQLYHQRMLESQQIHTMIDVAETMTNPTERDRMKQEIILKVLNVGS
ncbi:MAG TPA: hypothetical protein VKC61_20760 [Pyrinomonadaceae bacterium]|nr:hypothetical protein [Pyrinomonadaceae bacterium]